MLVTVNNDDSDYVMTLPAQPVSEYVGALSGERVSVNGGNISVNVKANAGEIWAPAVEERKDDDKPASVLPDAADFAKKEEKSVQEHAAESEPVKTEKKEA